MALAFARQTKGNAHIVLIGRNGTAAKSIISRFPPPTNPLAKHEFVEADVSLMANVRSTSAVLREKLDKINFLVMSPGIMNSRGRTETSEGIDVKLALHYYARFAFTHELLPLLKSASEREGEDAKVYSVLGAGVTGDIDLNDLGLKKTFSLSAAALQAPSYNDAAFSVSIILPRCRRRTKTPNRNSLSKILI